MGRVGRVGRGAGGREVSGRREEASAGFLAALWSVAAAQPDSICVCESQLIGILPAATSVRHTHTDTRTQPAVRVSPTSSVDLGL